MLILEWFWTVSKQWNFCQISYSCFRDTISSLETFDHIKIFFLLTTNSKTFFQFFLIYVNISYIAIPAQSGSTESSSASLCCLKMRFALHLSNWNFKFKPIRSSKVKSSTPMNDSIKSCPNIYFLCFKFLIRKLFTLFIGFPRVFDRFLEYFFVQWISGNRHVSHFLCYILKNSRELLKAYIQIHFLVIGIATNYFCFREYTSFQ